MSCQVLEQALKQYTGTLVLATHDRHLINTLADRVAYVAGGQVTLLPGNYDDFHRLWKDRLAPAASEPKQADQGQAKPAATRPKGKNKRGPKSAAQKRAEAEARNRLYQRIKPLKTKIAQVETAVDEISERLDQLVQEMADPEVYKDGERFSRLSQEHAALTRRLERNTVRWEELSLKLEELQQARD